MQRWGRAWFLCCLKTIRVAGSVVSEGKLRTLVRGGRPCGRLAGRGASRVRMRQGGGMGVGGVVYQESCFMNIRCIP